MKPETRSFVITDGHIVRNTSPSADNKVGMRMSRLRAQIGVDGSTRDVASTVIRVGGITNLLTHPHISVMDGTHITTTPNNTTTTCSTRHNPTTKATTSTKTTAYLSPATTATKSATTTSTTPLTTTYTTKTTAKITSITTTTATASGGRRKRGGNNSAVGSPPKHGRAVASKRVRDWIPTEEDNGPENNIFSRKHGSDVEEAGARLLQLSPMKGVFPSPSSFLLNQTPSPGRIGNWNIHSHDQFLPLDMSPGPRMPFKVQSTPTKDGNLKLSFDAGTPMSPALVSPTAAEPISLASLNAFADMAAGDLSKELKMTSNKLIPSTPDDTPSTPTKRASSSRLKSQKWSLATMRRTKRLIPPQPK